MQLKTLQERQLVRNADTYNVQRHGLTTQTGSHDGWRSSPNKQIDLCDSAAVHCGQARDFLWLSPFFAKQKEDEKFQ